MDSENDKSNELGRFTVKKVIDETILNETNYIH